MKIYKLNANLGTYNSISFVHAKSSVREANRSGKLGVIEEATGKSHPESVPVGKELLSWRQFDARVDPPVGRLQPS